MRSRTGATATRPRPRSPCATGLARARASSGSISLINPENARSERLAERLGATPGETVTVRRRQPGGRVGAPVSDLLAEVVEQEEAKRLLRTALDEGDAHAFLLHGPRGDGEAAGGARASRRRRSGRRSASRTAPTRICTCSSRSATRSGSTRSASCAATCTCARSRRRAASTCIFGAELMNDEAADALLKDLEEPPAYARILLVADELGPISPTLRSRCQLVPFRRLSEPAVRAHLQRLAPALGDDEAAALARLAAGRLDRAERLLDPEATRAPRDADRARAGGLSRRGVRPRSAAAAALGEALQERGLAAKARAEEEIAGRELTKRDAEQHVRRVQRGAEREELLASLEELAHVVPRPRRRRGRRDGALAHRDRAARARGGRRRRSGSRRRRGGGGARPRDVAAARRVQRERPARARGALRPPPRRLRGVAAGALSRALPRREGIPQGLQSDRLLPSDKSLVHVPNPKEPPR